MRTFQRILIVSLTAMSFAVSGTLFAQFQYQSAYPDIPIVDVHVHPAHFPPHRVSDGINHVRVSERIKERYGSNLAFWIGLTDPGKEIADQIKAGTNNRFLFAASMYRPQFGLQLTAEEVIHKVRDEGYVGLKFWFGHPTRVLTDGREGVRSIDDPQWKEFFTALEKAEILLMGVHVADPNHPFGNRGEWCPDPVEFWQQIRALENLIARHPNMTIISAHGAWLVSQDAQIDFLRYLLATYPNFYVDISATCHHIDNVRTDNLRDLYIEYQDRFLFGSDGTRVEDGDGNGYWEVGGVATRYARLFAILETDQVVPGGFFETKPTQGLNLPREVLEKIYYKNAVKLIPGLKEAMEAAGALPAVAVE